jgi:eukaryotic-like serine/threonine-protein kinase
VAVSALSQFNFQHSPSPETPMKDGVLSLSEALSSRYRLERELGQGGMATVYQAEDLKHGRRVAIKVLRPELAAVIGAERFLREIKTIAVLQHPHILGLIDSGEVQGTAYYVMPFVEGESLRDRLTREKQLPIPDAVRIATEVASALDYAHRHGVIHRDIKPENILLHDGTALVADFGIALAVSSAGGSRLTETGLSLGTPHYMSPEQAMGEREITARSDVYALGCVTYEMLTGDPPFTGSTAQAIVAKVMTEKPASIRRLRERVPQQVEDAVLTALEKLPADRFGSAAEFAQALTSTSSGRFATGIRPSEMPAPVPARRISALYAGLGAVLLLALLGGTFVAGRRYGHNEAVLPPSRLAILAPSLGGTGQASLFRQIAVMPDGSGIIFVSQNRQGNNTLAYEAMDAAAPIEIAGSQFMLSPQVSPDGRWLIGWAAALSGSDRAYRIPVSGGTPEPLPLEVRSQQAAWDSKGNFWFTQTPGGRGIARLTPDGKVGTELVTKTVGLLLQQILPGDQYALTVRAPFGSGAGPCILLDLRSGEQRTLLDLAMVEARYTSGNLIYVQPNGTLWAVPFHAPDGVVSGGAVQLADNITNSGNASAQLAVAPNGLVAYIPEEPRTLVFADRNGSFRPVVDGRQSFHAPQFSPDGRRISVDFTSGEGRDVWVLSLDQRTLSRATFVRDGHDAVWSPDGQTILFTSFAKGVFGLMRTRPGSTAPPESLLASAHLGYTGKWLPDGHTLVTTGIDLEPGSGNDIVEVENDGRGPIKPLQVNPFITRYAAPSPDGHWLAFASDQSGAQQVYVGAMSGEGDLVQMSQSGGSEPIWSPDGKELFYRGLIAGRVELTVAEVRTTPRFEIVSQKRLFDLEDILGATPHANYDISPDGKTFVMVRRSPATRIVVIQNLGEMVRRLRSSGGSQ